MENPEAAALNTRRRGFRGLLHSHHHVIMFVGALIVFTTFVLKEAVREHVKELKDSLDTAETVFVTRTDLADILRALQFMDIRVTDAEPARQRLKGEDRLLDQRNRDVVVNMNSRSWAELSLDIISRLAEKIGTGKYQTELAGFEQNLDDLQKEFRSSAGAPPETFRAVQFGTAKLIEELRAFGLSVFRNASTERKRREKQYETVTWASYMLYSLGWGLGLVGKLSSIEIFGGE